MLNKVEICGVNTSKLPVLNKEKKEELLKKIKDGDEEARTVITFVNICVFNVLAISSLIIIVVIAPLVIISSILLTVFLTKLSSVIIPITFTPFSINAIVPCFNSPAA